MQRAHEQSFERLNQRILGDKIRQRSDRCGGMAESRLNVRPLHHRVQPPPVATVTHLASPFSRKAGQGRSPPQAQRRSQRGGSISIAAPRVTALFNQAPKSVQIHQIRIDIQHVAGVPTLDPHRRPTSEGGRPPQQPTDPAQVRIHHIADFDGRVVVPDPIDERLNCNRSSRVHGQRRQHCL
jgi:hypothetical protein